ncbi:hypothetical protein [Desulforhopalus singaporensis]|uniref:Uncharacterized protein n=1 Tax=Desulforhopalus singaporensis TaxID=91360 RepID=A0A1H0QQ99_9BACT|nr:hypothetical protein [Desulforhopalus singaporensis]SDP19533.1 hypothetical protein SAMN05660330_02075 [Desulforhopalus singaporensis]
MNILSVNILRRWIPPILFELMNSFRASYLGHIFAEQLKSNKVLAGRHSGERCFIVGSGPSLKSQDISRLADENVILLNNFFVHPLFSQIVEGAGTKYYLSAPTHPPQTRQEWKDWYQAMAAVMPPRVEMLFGLARYKDCTASIIEELGLFDSQRKYWYLPGRRYDPNLFNGNEKYLSADHVMLTARAASIYGLIWAVFFGFSEIILLGMDHNYILFEYESEMRMYEKGVHQNNELARTFGDSFYTQEFLRQYEIFSEYTFIRDHSRARILNATTGGLLRVFPRIVLDDLWSNEY